MTVLKDILNTFPRNQLARATAEIAELGQAAVGWSEPRRAWRPSWYVAWHGSPVDSGMEDRRRQTAQGFPTSRLTWTVS